jgi:MtrB/PioB family decaheme-associated outer membrane protein
MSSRSVLALALLVLAAAVVVPTPAPAQLELGGPWSLNVEGNVELGGRVFINEPAPSRRAKWEEYRDFPVGPFLYNLELRIFRPDESYSAEFAGSKWGQTDQEYSLRVGRLGLWEFGFDWDQIPHVYSTTARFLATEASPGVFVLPTPRPPLETYNSAPTLDEIAQQWDQMRTFFRITPTPDLDLKAEYTRIRKSGDRPFSMAFGSPGNNFYQILEPIAQTVHDFRIGGTWAKENWQLQFGYVLSVFTNDLNSVQADNPCSGAVAPMGCAAGDSGAAAPTRGLIALAPDNIANTFTVNGGLNLPWWRTRLTGNFSYSLQLQNQDFVAQTINPLLLSNPTLALPQDSLNGNVQTILVNLGAVSRPVRDLTLSLKYRLFDYSDHSDEVDFPALVLDDRSILPGRRSPRFDYQRQNADAQARWQVLRQVALTLGAGWEHWQRSPTREVVESDEPYAKAAIDYTPFDWLIARLTYRPAFRRISNYNTGARAEHSVEGDPDPAMVGQSVLLRKFDQAERDRQQVDLLLQMEPLEGVSIAPTGSFIYDNYVGGPAVDPANGQPHDFLGLQKQVGWTIGIDTGWSFHERAKLSLGYMHESYYRKMDSRSRPVIGPVARDFADFDWISNITDTIETLYGGVKVAIIPGVLDWGLNASWAFARGSTNTRNPQTPVSSTPANNSSATAKPFPVFDDELARLETAVAYHFPFPAFRGWTAKLGYVFESWQQHDWRSDKLNPFIPGVSSIFLGNDLRSYTAHTIVATLGYRFK